MRDVCRLELPFLFSVQGKPFRAAKPQRQTVVSFQTVPIPSVSGDDAPLAVRWSSFNLKGGYLDTYASRRFEGRLYRAIEQADLSTASPRALESGLEVLRDPSKRLFMLSFLASNLPRQPFLRTGSDGTTWPNKEHALTALRGSSGRALRSVSDDELERV